MTIDAQDSGVLVLGAAARREIAEAAKAARMAYAMARPETGDLHIERIVRLVEGGDAAREHSPPGD
jgi:hypothetical protein